MAPVARMCRFYLALFYIKMIKLTYHDLKAKLYLDENLFYKFCCQPLYFMLGELKFVFSKKMSLYLFNITALWKDMNILDLDISVKKDVLHMVFPSCSAADMV